MSVRTNVKGEPEIVCDEKRCDAGPVSKDQFADKKGHVPIVLLPYKLRRDVDATAQEGVTDEQRKTLDEVLGNVLTPGEAHREVIDEWIKQNKR